MTFRKTDLVHMISEPRLAPYLRASPGDLGGALDLYRHNQIISEALYVPLQNLEVGLRNSLKALFQVHFGCRWFESGLLRKPAHIRAVQEASQPLSRKLLSGRLEGSRRLPNRIFHHEPILKLSYLPRTHGDIRFIMRLLSPSLASWNQEHDRFPALMASVARGQKESPCPYLEPPMNTDKPI